MLRHFIPRNDGRVCAFTLAEVLITLVIIGIIAALTIPNLLQKYQEQTTVKKVQKFYSTLSNAYSLAMKENGPADDWGLGAQDTETAIKIYEILFKPYFKIAKDCGVDNKGACIIDSRYKYLHSETYGDIGSYGKYSQTYYKLLLDDGAAVFIRGGNSHAFLISYDINGKKGPNQCGVDLFAFWANKNKIYPNGSFTLSSLENCLTKGDSCTPWVVYKGNMDYLHCEGLTWTSRSCKDK